MKAKQIPPNLVTLTSLVAALLALQAVHVDMFVVAAWLIVLSMLCDGLDGKLARTLGASTHFGAEFDSLSDFVAFGVVPGFLAWRVGLHQFGVMGAVVAIAFVVAGGLRLARFNIKNDDLESKKPFEGLPIPSAAGMVASLVILQLQTRLLPNADVWLLVIVACMTLLMISSIEYPPIDRRELHSLKARALGALALAVLGLAFWFPHYVFFGVMSLYVLWGVLRQAACSLHLYKPAGGEQDNNCKDG
ncbi:MAG: CDP-diacylglycerol--serine O-phosphatidyltransferase [Candidatus Cloacimonetes bacterium]|nr:CDP-diacylglycerol--serine O-phosphatidyltransferase [Candidatus Cloacimonadota bacterium]